MSVSRRELLAFGGTAALSMIAGCSALSTETEASTSTSVQPITVRLRGPDTDRVLFEQGDVTSVGPVTETNNRITFPITLTDEATGQVADVFDAVGVDEDPTSFEVAVFEGDREITSFEISPELSSEITSSDWSGELRLAFEQRSAANSMRQRLVCGAEATPCDTTLEDLENTPSSDRTSHPS